LGVIDLFNTFASCLEEHTNRSSRNLTRATVGPESKLIQEQRSNKKHKPLPPLQPGGAIRMKLPGDNKWSLGSCVKDVPNQSYEVEVAGCQYHHNRYHLRATAEAPPSPAPSLDVYLLHNNLSAKSPCTSQETPNEKVTSADVTTESFVDLQWSSHINKPPVWRKDYIMNTLRKGRCDDIHLCNIS